MDKSPNQDALSEINAEFPKYFDVDDTPIVLSKIDNHIIGLTWSGHPYPVGKTMAEGQEIDLKEYVRLVNLKMN